MVAARSEVASTTPFVHRSTPRSVPQSARAREAATCRTTSGLSPSPANELSTTAQASANANAP